MFRWGRSGPDPDGSVDVTSDVLSIIARFGGIATARVKTRVDLATSIPDGAINITDVLMAINAFQGLPYPFAPSGIEPCS